MKQIKDNLATLSIRVKINSLNVFFPLMICVLFSGVSFGQKNDEESKFNTGGVPNNFFQYLLDDTYLLGGINRGGVFWSNYYPELSDGNGFHVGIESYTPFIDKAFFNFGILYSQKRFSHSPSSSSSSLTFYNHSIESPLFVSFELPVLRSFDFRFNLGVQLQYTFNLERAEEYAEDVFTSDAFFYPKDGRYKPFDGGMMFGLSMERNNFYFRLRSGSGSNNFYSGEQGMLHAFYIDFGYFLLRKIRSN